MSVHNEYTGCTFEAFIAETYVQLVTTKSMCYSTSRWRATVLCCGHSVNERLTVLYGAFYGCTVWCFI